MSLTRVDASVELRHALQENAKLREHVSELQAAADATAGEPLRAEFFARISDELDRAYAKHGREPWGRHEFFAILKEEVDELWDDIKADAPDEPMYEEMVQIAAMCFRFFETGGCRYRAGARAKVAE